MFKGDVVFIKFRKYIVFIWIMEGRNVAISLVLAMILELTCFSTCVFNEFLLRFWWKNHVHWWSPRLKNSGNPCAKLIILVFSICSIVKDLEKHEKIMKFRRPYGVTHKGFSVIFTDFREDFKVDIWKIRFFKNRSGAYIVSISEVFRVAPMQPRHSLIGSKGACCGVRGAALN